MDGGMKYHRYAPHKCLLCDTQTKRLTYCDLHFDFLTEPQFVFPKKDTLPYADCVGKAPTRRESVNSMR